MGTEELYALITLLGKELGVGPIKMAKLATQAILAVRKMKLSNQNAEPPQFPEEEL